MSKFLSEYASRLSPYTPGEQPRDMSYIKLNTNECPYPPGRLLRAAVQSFDCTSLRLYPDPDSNALKQAAAEAYGLLPEQVFAGADNSRDVWRSFSVVDFFLQ